MFYEKLTQISESATDSDNDDVVVSGDMSEHANDPESHATITAHGGDSAACHHRFSFSLLVVRAQVESDVLELLLVRDNDPSDMKIGSGG